VSAEDRELEALLRRALADEAGRIEPGGDGLRRIRERTARRRWDWSRWRVPAQALAGAAALAAAIVAASALLPAPPDAPDTPVGPPAASAPSPPVSTTAGPVESTLIAGAGVIDMTTVWPYPSRRVGYDLAERDIGAGRYPDLTRPDVAAVAFVESYVGTGQDLTAESAGAWKVGLRMEVRNGGAPVSLVYLVRVRIGNDAPYVVVEAGRPSPPTLTLDPPPALAGTAPLRVGGMVRRYPGDAAPVLTAQLRAAGAEEALATAEATVTGRGEDRVWSATLAPDRAATAPTAAVAAWITDPSGRLAEFVAAPTATP
jgi:hypothetical protein